jgi:hypothetical protein
MKDETSVKRPCKSCDEPGATATALPELGGASIIDENGDEIPITEAMIRATLDELDAAWHRERRRRERARRRPRHPRSREA